MKKRMNERERTLTLTLGPGDSELLWLSLNCIELDLWNWIRWVRPTKINSACLMNLPYIAGPTKAQRDSSQKIEISLICYSPLCWWRLRWHFLNHIIVLEFHSGKEFYPMKACHGHVLQHKNRKNTRNMSPYCLWDVIQASRRCESLI